MSPGSPSPGGEGAGGWGNTICRYLRSKSGLGYTEGGDEPWLLLDAGTAVSQCLRTMEPFGPDDGYAEPALCQAGRSCFAPPDAP